MAITSTKPFSSSATTTTIVTNEKASSQEMSWEDRLERILSQDRDALNFPHYTLSKDHIVRMKMLAQQAPELYDNPEITPRAKWFHHPRYAQNSQMPPFHLHFRLDMQEVLENLLKAYSVASALVHNSASNLQTKAIERAFRIFYTSMNGLNGHVSIEEYSCFPMYQDLFPHVELQFFYDDHTALKQLENTVMSSLNALLERGHHGEPLATAEEILNCLIQVMDFDDELMAHLGEEEEILVPMSLTDKDVCY